MGGLSGWLAGWSGTLFSSNRNLRLGANYPQFRSAAENSFEKSAPFTMGPSHNWIYFPSRPNADLLPSSGYEAGIVE